MGASRIGPCSVGAADAAIRHPPDKVSLLFYLEIEQADAGCPSAILFMMCIQMQHNGYFISLLYGMYRFSTRIETDTTMQWFV